jgi:hypothetical protein
MKLRKSTRVRWVVAMHLAAIRRMWPHVLAHPRDLQARNRMTLHIEYSRRWFASPWWDASDGLHEHGEIYRPVDRSGRPALTVRTLNEACQ